MESIKYLNLPGQRHRRTNNDATDAARNNDGNASADHTVRVPAVEGSNGIGENKAAVDETNQNSTVGTASKSSKTSNQKPTFRGQRAILEALEDGDGSDEMDLTISQQPGAHHVVGLGEENETSTDTPNNQEDTDDGSVPEPPSAATTGPTTTVASSESTPAIRGDVEQATHPAIPTGYLVGEGEESDVVLVEAKVFNRKKTVLVTGLAVTCLVVVAVAIATGVTFMIERARPLPSD